VGEIAPLQPPAPLASHHDLAAFCCGDTPLDDWLKRRAGANQASGASRTFVLCQAESVVGYYALSSGSVSVEAAPGRFRRNMPSPIPIVVLGRLAVDQRWQGRGIGRALFRDAAQRVVQAAEVIGVRGILVHAISEQARSFYLALGFDPSPLQPMTLMVTLADVRAALE
jgi:GNAT superfamily N-acetyltransferase